MRNDNFSFLLSVVKRVSLFEKCDFMWGKCWKTHKMTNFLRQTKKISIWTIFFLCWIVNVPIYLRSGKRVTLFFVFFREYKWYPFFTHLLKSKLWWGHCNSKFKRTTTFSNKTIQVVWTWLQQSTIQKCLMSYQLKCPCLQSKRRDQPLQTLRKGWFQWRKLSNHQRDLFCSEKSAQHQPHNCSVKFS